MVNTTLVENFAHLSPLSFLAGPTAVTATNVAEGDMFGLSSSVDRVKVPTVGGIRMVVHDDIVPRHDDDDEVVVPYSRRSRNQS